MVAGLGLALYFPPLAILRPVAGFLVIFFGSGYALLAALYPDPIVFDHRRRLAGSFGLSLITSGILLLVVSLTIGLTLVNGYLALLTWILMMSVLAWRRRAAFKKSAVEPAHASHARNRWSKRSRRENVLAIVEMVAIGLLLLSGAHLLWVSAHSEAQFSEFYLLGPDGKAANYPKQVTAGSSIETTIGIKNHEGQAVEYGLAYQVEDGHTRFLHSVPLQPEQVWQSQFDIQVPDIAGLHKVIFTFWNAETGQVYDTLHLWVGVE
jgi:uncharacterized membrane protein